MNQDQKQKQAYLDERLVEGEQSSPKTQRAEVEQRSQAVQLVKGERPSTKTQLSKSELKRRALEINGFKLPKWDEIPEDFVMRKKMLDYIDDVLSPLYPEGGVLTGTMVQNYIKWGLVPAPVQRRYG